VPGFSPPAAAGVSGVTQRLIVRYAKRGRMRFASHRDIARAVERGIRRAGLPIAFSEGFTPHPKISYAGAAPTGTASEAEYLELSLTRRCTAAEVRERLDAALPDGMDVIEVTEAAPSLAALPLEASHWHVALPGVRPDEASRAVEQFLGCQSVEVERLTSKGTRRVDARAAVVAAAAAPARRLAASPGPAVSPRGSEPQEPPGAAGAAGQRAAAGPDLVGLPGDVAGNAILRMVVRHMTPAVRPDDILAALRSVAGLAPSSPPVVTRLAQGALDEVTEHAGWSIASGTGARGDNPEGRPTGLPVAGSGAAPGRDAPDEQVKTTRHGAETAGQAGPPAVGTCNQLPRGADGPQRTAAPGSLTGDSPDARERAERQRIRR
jgi:radical SAM-linked protein